MSLEKIFAPFDSVTKSGNVIENFFQDSLASTGSKVVPPNEPPKAESADSKKSKIELALERSADYAYENAEPDYTGKCSRYVREALNFGFESVYGKKFEKIKGVGKGPTIGARNYGPNLKPAGYLPLITYNKSGNNITTYIKNKRNIVSPVDYPVSYIPRLADVMVIQATGRRHKRGHIAIYTKHGWVSDTLQGGEIWVEGEYRRNKPSYTIWRVPMSEQQQLLTVK
jgi:hypothetical protein